LRPDPVILAFDTSAAHCAAALLQGDRLIEARSEELGRGQAERLMPMLEEMLARAGLGWSDLDAIGVGTGPGNFTGVRLSVAAARGLALALGIPAIGVTSLEARAYGLPRPVLVALDARRGQVYMELFTETAAEEPVLADSEALPAWAFGREAVTGDAAERIALLINAPKVLPPAMPLAEAMARIARDRVGKLQPRPAPLYLRAADAAPPREAPPELLQ
jgi:tRNA threonylcarbamoyladenosine biosynthesis protein TsaB